MVQGYYTLEEAAHILDMAAAQIAASDEMSKLPSGTSPLAGLLVLAFASSHFLLGFGCRRFQDHLDNGITLYRISTDARVAWNSVQRFMHRERSLSLASFDQLCRSLELELNLRPKSMRRSDTDHG